MKMLVNQIWTCSTDHLLLLVKADLIPQIITTLNPLSLSLAEAEDVHTYLLSSINSTVWHATPFGFTYIGIEDRDEQLAIRKAVFEQVLAPSEKYIWHLCTNRFSIIDGDQSKRFLALLAGILAISLSYQPTMNFVLHMPFFLSISSCLTFFELSGSVWCSLYNLLHAQLTWNKQGGEPRRSGTAIFRSLRMEGIEDVNEEKLLNELRRRNERDVVEQGIEWCNLHGMNLPRL
ncbi:hypothetical protein BLNAU_1154 [Blattamonas nauphoetae]|uniref:Uncharacterized protein n=1 Tax=Blattamonas nauphoetae TaxID=2049346 RepID=A0ABQ9YK15_9EUKA|nr:hypothetical protein BLNAU_1154 [Blattamonas nauphoetae]